MVKEVTLELSFEELIEFNYGKKTFWHREQQVGRPYSPKGCEVSKKTKKDPSIWSSESKERVLETALVRQWSAGPY